MPGQTVKSSLASVLGGNIRKAHDEHRADPLRRGITDPPAGINRGVAQLVAATWGVHEKGNKNEGKPYVTFQSVIKSPTEHDGQPCEGLRISRMFPIYATPYAANGLLKLSGTPENWWGEVLNQIGMFVGEDAKAEIDFDNVEDVLKSLTEAKPHHYFSTRRGKESVDPVTKKVREPRTFTTFGEACNFEENGSVPAGAVEDHTEEFNEFAPSPGSEAEAAELPEDLDELLALANQEDEDASQPARDKLLEIAVASGIDEAAAKKTETWDELVEMIKAQAEGGELEGEDEEEEEEEEAFKPTKGLVCKWLEVDPKTGKTKVDPKTKKAVKAIEVEVLTVYPKNETCTVKNTTTGKTLAGADKLPRKIGWSELIHD